MIRQIGQYGGMTKEHWSKLRAVWRQMKRRCTSPKDDKYTSYGARGIRVCDEWQDFQVFYDWAVTAGYRPGLSIDRIDNDGPYAPENCRWADRATQSSNTRTNRRITAFGETKTMAEWARDPRCAVDYAALYLRIVRRGWDSERALTAPQIKNNDQATHCPQNHEYTEDNIIWDGPERTWRKCKTCTVERVRKWREKKGPARAG